MAIPVRRSDGVTHIGIEDNLEEQPGLTVQVGEGGLWTIVTVYECDYRSVIRLCPKPYSKHKEYPFALLVGIAITREEAMRAKLECTYRGVTGDFQQASSGTYTLGPGETREIIAGGGEEPIETHPNYNSLTTSQLAEIRKYCDNPTGSPPLTPVPAAQELIEKKLKGIDTYVTGAPTFRVTYNSANPPVSLANVGKIVSAPSGAPEIVGTWLFVGYNSRQQGGAYEISGEWRASGPAGWDTDIYGA